jgi:hypothetical protein
MFQDPLLHTDACNSIHPAIAKQFENTNKNHRSVHYLMAGAYLYRKLQAMPVSKSSMETRIPSLDVRYGK